MRPINNLVHVVSTPSNVITPPIDYDAVGFVNATTDVTQHLPLELRLDEAKQRGLLDRTSNSQLLLLTDAEYEAGLRRITAERPVLRADLRLFATTAVPGTIEPGRLERRSADPHVG